MEKISLDFEKGNGLIPVVIQDYESNEVLMFAYMSQESFNLTLKNNKTWFYSRSRNELWNKGATSGKGNDKDEIISEICDLTYHILVLMAEKEINLGELNNELSKRRNKINNFKGERKSIEEF